MAGYGTDVGFEAWLTANGYTVPVSAPTSAVLRQRGSTYIDATFGERFPGYPTGGIEQDRLWPRTGATDAYGTAIGASTVPTVVIQASYMAGYLEATKPGSLSITINPNARVKRQKVEGIEREFFEPGKSDFFAPNAPVNSLIEGMLAPLIGTSMPLPAILVV